MGTTEPPAIAVVRRDNQILVGTHDDLRDGVARLAGRGRWPSWSSGGNLLAWSDTTPGPGDALSSVRISNAWPGSEGQVVYRVATGSPPVIAARVPHYVLWSPTGRELAVVAPSPIGLEMQVVQTGELVAADDIFHGAPIFPAWSPSGAHLAVHATSELLVMDRSDGRRTPVTARAQGFRTVAWHASGGRFAFAVPAEGGVHVTLADCHGERLSEAATMPGAVALAFRGATDELSIALSRRPETGLFEGIWATNVTDRRPPRLVVTGPLVACFWSPDGSRAVLVVPYHSGDQRVYLRTIDPDGNVIATSESFVPSQDFRLHCQFFDQYALSHPLWSPSGDAFLAAGRLVHDGTSQAFGDPLGDRILSWSCARGAPLEELCAGELGVFAPPAPTP